MANWLTGIQCLAQKFAFEHKVQSGYQYITVAIIMCLLPMWYREHKGKSYNSPK